MRIQACDSGEELVERVQMEFVGEDLGDDCCLLASVQTVRVQTYLREDTLAPGHLDTVQSAPAAG